MTQKNYYKILQVDPSAEQEVIEGAYKRLALKYHPDMNKSPESTRRMQDLNEAYAILSDTGKRESYDRELDHLDPVTSTWQEQAQAPSGSKRREENYADVRAEVARRKAEYEREQRAHQRQEESESRHREQARREQEARERNEPRVSLSGFLQQADTLGRSGEVEKAADVLEQAVKADRSWSEMIAGTPHNSHSPAAKPGSGFGLLVHYAVKFGREELAVGYYSRMLDLNPKMPEFARQAVEDANIEFAAGIRQKPIRLLIVEENRDTREGLRRLLGVFHDIDILDTASNGGDAVDKFNSLKPDVMTTGLKLPVMDGIMATSLICRSHPDARVVIVSIQSDLDSRKKAKAAGACDFFSKPPLPGKFITGIRRAAGRIFYPVEKDWWLNVDR